MPPRAAVLARVRAAVDRGANGSFCFECGAPDVAREENAGGETFICSAGHRARRSFLFDGLAVFSFEQDRLVHETAGAVVRRDGRVLLFLRSRFPLLYTIPSGHLEVGQDPESEMRREVLEETGLVVRTARRLWPEEALLLEDPCRRGADSHRWHLYEAEADGMPRLSEEGRIIGWYDPGEIAALAARKLLTQPAETFLRRL